MFYIKKNVHNDKVFDAIAQKPASQFPTPRLSV